VTESEENTSPSCEFRRKGSRGSRACGRKVSVNQIIDAVRGRVCRDGNTGGRWRLAIEIQKPRPIRKRVVVFKGRGPTSTTNRLRVLDAIVASRRSTAHTKPKAHEPAASPTRFCTNEAGLVRPQKKDSIGAASASSSEAFLLH